jgi:glucosylceramidase
VSDGDNLQRLVITATPRYIAADNSKPVTIAVVAGSTLSYANAQYAAADGTIASGASATFATGQWVWSVDNSAVTVLVSPIVVGSTSVSVTQAQQYRTLPDGSQQFNKVQPPPFAQRSTAGLNPVIVRPEDTFQEIVGLGAALTDSSANLLWQMTKANRTALLKELFAPDQGNLSAVRISFGSNDFRTQNAYTYDDNGGVASGTGTPDIPLANFSIGPDNTYLLPLLQQILAINPRVKVFSGVWFQPPWMRVSGTPPTFDDTTYGTAFANYIVRSIQAYEAAGVPIYAVTAQNEPTGNFVRWTSAQMLSFIGTKLGPALDTAGLRTRIVTHDDNWNQSSFATAVLADATAGPFVEGIAWHGYGGTPDAQNTVRRAYPTKSHYFTELRTMQTDNAQVSVGIIAGDAIIGAFRNWARASLLWNVALDESGGPVASASTGRRGVVTINSGTLAVTRNIEYYALRHIAQFLQPGAKRCASTTYGQGHSSATVQTVAFVNPDESVVLFCVNNSANAQTFRVMEGRSSGSFPITMQPGEMSTFVWGTTAQSAPAGTDVKQPVAVNQTQAVIASGASGTFKHNVPPQLTAPLLVAEIGLSTVAGGNDPTCQGVTFQGQALTRLTRASANPASTTNRVMELWYLVNPPSGGGDVVMTAGAGQTVNFFANALTLDGVNQATPFGTPATDTGSKNNPSATTTGGSATDLILAAVAARTTTAPAPATQMTPIATALQGTNGYAVFATQPGGSGSIASAFSWTTADNTGLIAVAVQSA